jgi:hypothetical protein
MAKAETTVKVKKEVIVCDRCSKAKSVDAKPLRIIYDGNEVRVTGHENYSVCVQCSEIIAGSLIKVERKRPVNKGAATAQSKVPATEAVEP